MLSENKVKENIVKKTIEEKSKGIGPEWMQKLSKKVPNIPFKKNWQDVVLKRLIRNAAENDFDAIALAGGNIQADRYDLSKQEYEVKLKLNLFHHFSKYKYYSKYKY